MFRRGVYLAEHTLQAASVEFVPLGGTNDTRSRLQKTCRKAPEGVFDSLGCCPSGSSFFWDFVTIRPGMT